MEHIPQILFYFEHKRVVSKILWKPARCEAEISK